MAVGSRPQRGPTLGAALLLLIGVWASLATSTPATESETSGQFIIEPDEPTVVLSVAAKAPDEFGDGNVRLAWLTTSASGEQPQLSVTVAPDDVEGVYWFDDSGMGASLSTASTPLRITVLNTEETGPVTFDWTLRTSVDGNADVKTRVDPTPAMAANPRAALPMPRTDTSPLSVLQVGATVPNESVSPGVQIDLGQPRADGRRLAGVVVDDQGATSDLSTDGAVVPWPDSCPGALCTVNFDLVIYGPAIFPIADTLDPAGTISVYRPPLGDATADISLPVSDRKPGSSSFVVTTGDDNDILDGYVTVSVFEQSVGEDGTPFSCPIEVTHSVDGKPSAGPQDVAGPPLRLQPGVASTIEFTRVAEQPICGPQPESATGFDVTVHTFGLASPSPARLSRP